MKLVYCVNIDNKHAYLLATKLSEYSKSGGIIFVTPEEMEILFDRTQFVPVELSDKEEK